MNSITFLQHLGMEGTVGTEGTVGVAEPPPSPPPPPPPPPRNTQGSSAEEARKATHNSRRRHQSRHNATQPNRNTRPERGAAGGPPDTPYLPPQDATQITNTEMDAAAAPQSNKTAT